MMNPQEGCESVSGKYLYGVVCLDRLEKACPMGLILTVSVRGLNSAMMTWNGPNLSFGSLANGLFRIS